MTSSIQQLEPLKSHYRSCSSGFDQKAKQGMREQKRLSMLGFGNFAWWAACVFPAVQETGSLVQLIENFGKFGQSHLMRLGNLIASHRGPIGTTCLHIYESTFDTATQQVPETYAADMRRGMILGY